MALRRTGQALRDDARLLRSLRLVVLGVHHTFRASH